MKQVKSLIAILVAFALLLTSVEPVSAAANVTVHFQVQYLQTESRAMLDQINAFRTGSDAWYWNSDNTTKTSCTGLSTLTYDYELEKIAMQRCAEIALSYGHTRPDGSSVSNAVNNAGYSWTALGENIAAGYNSYTTANSVFVGWQETDANYAGQGHRRNMLSGNYNRIGISGCKIGSRYYWVQVLARSSSAISQTAANDAATIVAVDASTITTTISFASSSISLMPEKSVAIPSATAMIKGANFWPTSQSGNISTDAITWSVGDTSIARISGTNIVGVAAGTTTLNATIYGTTKSIPIEVINHEHTYNSGVITKNPTCVSTGIKTFTCTSCGGTKTEEVPKSDDHAWGTPVVVKTANCKEMGEEKSTCSLCGAIMTRYLSRTTTHTWNSGVITKQPTCAATGVKTYTCTTCSATKTETVGKTTIHSWNSGSITKQPTCAATGVKTYTCSICGGTKTETIEKTTNHIWDDGSVAKQPTCVSTGIKTFTCSVCKTTKTETIPETTTHTWDDGVVTTPATYSSTGVMTYSCIYCTEQKTESIPMLTVGTVKNLTLANTTTGVKLTWSKVDGAGYYIFRKTSSGSTKIATIIGSSTLSYTEVAVVNGTKKLTSGTNYTYEVAAFGQNPDKTVVTGNKASASIRYLSSITPSLTNAASGIAVRWTAVPGASGYYVYRKSSGGSYARIRTITSGTTVACGDTSTLTNGAAYAYAVRAYYKDSAGKITLGSYTGKAIYRIVTPTLATPTNPSAGIMTVKWSKNTAASGYQIQYATNSSFSSAKLIALSGASVITRNIGSLKKGTTYYVRVRSFKKNSAGTVYYSGWSSTKYVKITR